VCIYTGNESAKFHGNILSLSENIARSFRGATFFDSHCTCFPQNIHVFVSHIDGRKDGRVEAQGEKERDKVP